MIVPRRSGRRMGLKRVATDKDISDFKPSPAARRVSHLVRSAPGPAGHGAGVDLTGPIRMPQQHQVVSCLKCNTVFCVRNAPTASTTQPHAGGRCGTWRPAKGRPRHEETGAEVYRSHQGDMERPTVDINSELDPLVPSIWACIPLVSPTTPSRRRASLQQPDAILHHRPRMLPKQPRMMPSHGGAAVSTPQ